MEGVLFIYLFCLFVGNGSVCVGGGGGGGAGGGGGFGVFVEFY